MNLLECGFFQAQIMLAGFSLANFGRKFSRSISSMGFYSSSMYISLLCLLALFNIPVHCAVSKLDGNTFENEVNQGEVVFVNFYADWCRFSQMLTPIFEEASNKFNGDARVKFASVDCDRHNDVAQKYHINKYPTLKLFRNGQLSKREYRGQRSVDAIGIIHCC